MNKKLFLHVGVSLAFLVACATGKSPRPTETEEVTGAGGAPIDVVDDINLGGAPDDDHGAGGSPQALGGGFPDVEYPDVSFDFDPTKNVDRPTCAEQSFAAEHVGVDMYVILDWSNSMTDGSSLGGDCPLVPENDLSWEDTKWCNATYALARYFLSEAATGNRAALQFMTQGGESPSCGADESNPHGVPLVDFTALPDSAEGPLITTLRDATPTGPSVLTFIESALNGLYTFTSNHAFSTPERMTAGVLITDGYPTGCSSNAATLSAIAEQMAWSGVVPFVVGMTGANDDLMEQVAMAGGGAYIKVDQGDPTEFVEVMEEIGLAAAGCDFPVPSSEDGLLDMDSVIVEMAEDGGEPISLQQVSGPDACTGAAEYYLTGMESSLAIELCAETCAMETAKTELSFRVSCEGN